MRPNGKDQILSTPIVSKIVQIFTKVHDVLNQNATIKSLNNITAAFDYMIESPGWAALDTFSNTLGNSFSVFDVISSGVDRSINRHKSKTYEAEKSIREEEMFTMKEGFRDELKSTLKRLKSELKHINEQLASDDEDDYDYYYNSYFIPLHDETYSNLETNDDAEAVIKDSSEYYEIEEKEQGNQLMSASDEERGDDNRGVIEGQKHLFFPIHTLHSGYPKLRIYGPTQN